MYDQLAAAESSLAHGILYGNGAQAVVTIGRREVDGGLVSTLAGDGLFSTVTASPSSDDICEDETSALSIAIQSSVLK